MHAEEYARPGAPNASVPIEAFCFCLRYNSIMFSRHRLAEVAALFADASRASILISLWDGRARPAGELTRLALGRARMCYDHLAGRLGVGITDALLKRGCLGLATGSLALTPAGRGWFKRFGVDVAAIEEARRPLVRTCLDWTERREHLAGALGAALASEMLEHDWLRRAREGRALLITTAGRRAVQRIFGLST